MFFFCCCCFVLFFWQNIRRIGTLSLPVDSSAPKPLSSPFVINSEHSTDLADQTMGVFNEKKNVHHPYTSTNPHFSYFLLPWTLRSLNLDFQRRGHCLDSSERFHASWNDLIGRQHESITTLVSELQSK